MATPDWRDLTAQHELTFQMVSQTNFTDTWGELDGVDLASSTLEAAYYTDERTSGKLSIVGGNWKRGSFIRVIHKIPKYKYTNVLGTYIVTDDSATWANGVWHYELELHSSLKMLAGDLLTRPWAIAKGASALSCMKAVLINSGAHSMRSIFGQFGTAADAEVALDTSLAEDKQATTAQIMAAGKSRLECMFALASMSNNRIDVHPHGYISVGKYINPHSKVPKFRIDLSDPRGVAVEGTLSRTTDWLSMPDTYAVQHTYSEEVQSSEKYTRSGTRKDGTTYKAGENKTENVQREIYGEAHLSASSAHSVAKRGYSIVRFESLAEMAPKTDKRAQEIAKERLKAETTELIEWELETVYLPLWEGDVVELVVPSGLYTGVRKCLVKNVSINLETMHMQLTLKETAAGDKGD